MRQHFGNQYREEFEINQILLKIRTVGKNKVQC